MSPQAPSESQALTATTRTAHVQSVLDRLLRNSTIYGTFLSTITLTSVTRGTATLRLELSSLHVNSKGGLHGAVSATIIDFTTGLAIASWDGRETTGASVDMHISYLSTAVAGDVVEVVATAERVGGSLAFITVRILKVEGEERKVVTIGQHTKYVKGTAPVLNGQ